VKKFAIMAAVLAFWAATADADNLYRVTVQSESDAQALIAAGFRLSPESKTDIWF